MQEKAVIPSDSEGSVATGTDFSATPRNDNRTCIAIYVHIPWCASICPYCDFDKQATDFRLVDDYVDALVAHIGAEPRRTVHSLYFGGGTPSLLTPVRLGRIIDACRSHFELKP